MFDIRKSIENNKLIISLSGEMDLSNHMVLIHVIENINSNDYMQTLIDIKNLNFVDSTGIKTFIDVSKLLMNKGKKKLKIINICDDIKEIFDLLNIEEVLGEEVFL
jgi:anti-sigma B factor antagonist